MRSQKNNSPSFSFEFFPPKTDEGKAKLAQVRDKLSQLKPRYFSVTYGAGGSTQEGTRSAIMDIKKSGMVAAPHLSCIGSTKQSIATILSDYQDNGIDHIVALRGDLPSGMRDPGELRYASELVEFIRQTTGDHFHIEVAAYPEIHPQAENAKSDLIHFVKKMNAGANSAITQYFYNIDAYLYFVEQCEKWGIDKPIVPGIMPITNYTNLARFSGMCGAEIPRWITKKLQSYGDDSDSIKAFGVDVVTNLCQNLLDSGAPGLHFYTLNQSEATMAIWNNLKI
jgi:methylenetetrahydrofolate reductase (NADPH)